MRNKLLNYRISDGKYFICFLAIKKKSNPSTSPSAVSSGPNCSGLKKYTMIIGHVKELEFLKKLATENRLGAGYIFFGAEGVGKRGVAMHLAEFLEHQKDDPSTLLRNASDGQAGPRNKKILQDAKVVAPDEAGTIGIDAAREGRVWLGLKPALSSRRTLIIDAAERMTGEAQNALLKISEDIPGAGLIILITRDPELLQSTLTSRFQEVFFSVVPVDEIVLWLQNTHDVVKEKAERAGARSLGRPGLAYRLCLDDTFRASLTTAEKFLNGGLQPGSAALKELVREETFDLPGFLDALALVLSWRRAENINPRTWHSVIALREQVSRLNLNPRIQLEALAIIATSD
jgi:DNA polymerase III subunit delta'